ncbi:hypothetical protein BDBG_08852 [Blastomyces gilchristii SLH14081]|uniref:Uncharacterized protein n=2 Tax=Blastomyces TaxID=229219 RepID=A0A179V511_BLAGS|nr:uncharacterized protein BDBG_08852 [Blastomyces gilchristii SLH14081]EGE85442.1 hypothetical protein BDDG_08387 [Blastomyces dermatitidis ATCC 18188]EQL28259.1 hypothetical protein BDFG_08989 [Blastomyces dermatitidis ATCC 26199]OAT13702.1 hypothetical protein BDBG_08852 [Blastomyces gilchristii SLH14081]
MHGKSVHGPFSACADTKVNESKPHIAVGSWWALKDWAESFVGWLAAKGPKGPPRASLSLPRVDSQVAVDATSSIFEGHCNCGETKFMVLMDGTASREAPAMIARN